MDMLPQQESTSERELQEISSSVPLDTVRYFRIIDKRLNQLLQNFEGEKYNTNLKMWSFMCKKLETSALEIAVRIRDEDVRDGSHRINEVFAKAAKEVLEDRVVEKILLEE